MTSVKSPFDRHISYALAAAHRSVTHSLVARAKSHGIQVEAWRVMELLDQDERLTMGDLALAALLNPPTLSKLVDRMVADGLVHRQVAKTDHRQINLLLTDLGRKRMLAVRHEAEAQDAQLAQTLGSSAQGVELLNLLKQLAS